VVTRPSAVEPIKPVTTGTRPSAKKRKENFAAAAARFLQVRLGVAERVAGQNEFGELTGTDGTPNLSRAAARRRALKRSP
jgi:hypothetical protein